MDYHLNRVRNTTFDVVFVPGGEKSAEVLCLLRLARF